MSTPVLHAPGRTSAPKKIGGGLLDPKQMIKSLPDALKKLNPASMWRNPVMFIVEIGAAFTTVLAIADPSLFAWATVVWLWLTAVFANLAEAVAEGRGKAQAATLRAAQRDTTARRLKSRTSTEWDVVGAPELRQGDFVVVEAGEIIYGLGGIIVPFLGIKIIDLLLQFLPGMS
ncbi:hypothetical protein [Acrocarpospora sp. B8E8]|uniref:hypothetical protein n=1 Tax=Acrocarpospora sp. B8E8 TaxID=3153572 RepID=UPI00325D4A5D